MISMVVNMGIMVLWDVTSSSLANRSNTVVWKEPSASKCRAEYLAVWNGIDIGK